MKKILEFEVNEKYKKIIYFMINLLKTKIYIYLFLTAFFLFNTTFLFASENNSAIIYHVVICWLKEPNNQEHRQKLIDKTKELQSIPGIISIKVGNMFPSNRPIVDSSFDIGIVMSFKDEKSMQEYLFNPIHQNATKEVLAPLTSKVVIYDIKIPNDQVGEL